MEPHEQYLTDYAASRAKSTFVTARTAVTRFTAWLEGRAITLPVLMEWHAHLSTWEHEPGTKNLELRHVKQFITWLVDSERIPPLNLRKLRRFKEDRLKPRILSKAEVRALVQACPGSPVGAITLAGLLIGARREELAAMLPEHIKADGVIVIYAPKTGVEREFDPTLLGSGMRLFQRAASASGSPFYWSRYHWLKLVDSIGLPMLPFKALRSTCSSFLKSGGVSPWAVEQMLGHSAGVAAKHYDRFVPGVHGGTIDRLYGCHADIGRACEAVELGKQAVVETAGNDDE